MSRKFLGFSAWPTFWLTRAAMGTAETPAEPMSGLTLPLVAQHMTLPSSTPPTVLIAKATRPMTTIVSVWVLRKISAVAVAPTETPRKMVMMLHSALLAVSTRRSTTPLSRIRLPSISMEISGAAEGSSSDTKIVTMIGKHTRSTLETGRSCSMTMERSFLVVSSFMIGGWMTGTSAM